MTPYYEDAKAGITIYHGDCREVLPTLGPVDHVITDPPYSEHVHSKSRAGTRVLSETGRPSDFSRAVDFGFEALTDDVRRLAGDYIVRLVRRWVLVFSDVESTASWRYELTCRGLDYVRTGAWVKLNATPQFTGDRPAVGFEAITIWHQPGRKKWNGGGTHAVWTHPVVNNRGDDDPRWHPTQKPAALMRELVTLFTDPGELVLDPFAGSMTTLVACKRLGRRAIGIELNEQWAEAGARRVEREQYGVQPSFLEAIG